MDTSRHNLNTLFKQLGLPSSTSAIDAFIDRYEPLPADLSIADAGIFSPTQQAFLREALAEDSDWSEAVDELSARLRHH